MALKIRWSEEALASLYDLYDYLESEWIRGLIYIVSFWSNKKNPEDLKAGNRE